MDQKPMGRIKILKIVILTGEIKLFSFFFSNCLYVFNLKENVSPL